MNEAKVLVARDISTWLRSRREGVRLTQTEAAQRARCPVSHIIEWEAGMPISFFDFLVLMQIYQVPGVVLGAYIHRLTEKYL